MELKLVDQELDKLDLSIVPLNILHPDHESYDVLFNQYKGNLTATPTFIGNTKETHALAITKLVEFARIGQEKNYDLLACPEYSCPWESVRDMHDNNILPNNAKLWIFGMESIIPSDLITFTEKNTKIKWIFDEDHVRAKHDKAFLDPVCILFKTTSKKTGAEQTVAFIQFKNSHMSIHTDPYREADFLIEGRWVYVLRNPKASISLLTLICSDSLVFSSDLLVNNNIDKAVLIHLQMNLHPRHTGFKEYRNKIFANAGLDKIEVLCLNWANGSKVFNLEMGFSGTGYYYKSLDPINEDDRLNLNSGKGLYYCYWKNNRCHVVFFNSSEMLIGFKADKPWQVLSNSVLQRRKGPLADSVYTWNGTAYDASNISDEFKAHCDALQCDLHPLDALTNTNKERFIRLSSGLNLKKDSFEVTSFDFYQIDDREAINRVTYTYETDLPTKQMKMDYLMRLKELVIIHKDPTLFPPELRSLTSESSLSYDYKVNRYVNVYSKEGQQTIGTSVYIGNALIKIAQATYDNLNKMYLDSISDTQKGRETPRIIVWYQDGALKNFFHLTNSIDKNFAADETSIDKE